MAKIKDISNQKFGNLTALYRTDKKGADRSYLWHCKCDCGNECDVNGSNLRNGHTTSCGCKKKIIAAQNSQKTINNLTNKKFGLLTVIEKTEKRNNGNIVWKCQCECGNICYIKSYSLVNGNTQSCGCLVSKGEKKINQILFENQIPFETQKIFDDCRFEDTNYPAKFDFYVNHQYLIEYDGKQHFKYRDEDNYYGWDNKEKFLKTQEHDKIKNKWCYEHNIPIIRIPYTYLNELKLEDLLLETSSFIVKEGGEEIDL